MEGSFIGFSGTSSIRITNANDFLAPSAACVLPVGGGARPSSSGEGHGVAKVRNEVAGSVRTPLIPVQTVSDGNSKAKVTISDCLSCSGCVTSADTVLLSAYSLDYFREVMCGDKDSSLFPVAALSQQVVASLAVRYNMDLGTTARKLSTFLREEIGFAAVIDLAFARHLTLLEAAEEFIQRYKAGKPLTISSACPGWVTYAEKTQGAAILDCISSVRSTQGMSYLLAQNVIPPKDKRKIWLTSLMPCHDKKLEASRPEFMVPGENGKEEREVDCVLTAAELVEVIKERNFNFREATESGFDEPFNKSLTKDFGANVGSGSGGFADFILRYAAKEILGINIPDGPLAMEQASKTGDVKSITVRSEDGSKELNFATAYGFRSLQNVLRKMRRGQCAYHYIELMACPGGCNNGGGLLEAEASDKDTSRNFKQRANEHLERLNENFSQARSAPDPLSLHNVRMFYDNVIKGSPGSVASKKMLTMSITSRKMQMNTHSSFEW